MTRKRVLAEQTRQRIVETTLRLHGEKGIFGTSWADIAREAGVAVGTVYRYFPSLDELVPACGELLFQRTQPPGPEDFEIALADASEPVERMRRVVTLIFGFYDRSGKFLESDLRERELPSVQEWEEYLRKLVRDFILEALRDVEVDIAVKERLCFLFDVPTFSAMRIRGLQSEEAASLATDLAARALGLLKSPQGQTSSRSDGRTPEV